MVATKETKKEPPRTVVIAEDDAATRKCIKAQLETLGKVSLLITQNVDQLHQRAGSQRVVDLHGSLDQVVCLDCSSRVSRDEIQDFLMQHNSILNSFASVPAPDIGN